nr:unnamed protein product [Digitaria exilis]
MGVMKPLLTKLVTLMGDKYKKLKGVHKEVLFLKDELGTMNALLEKMDDIDELDPLAKNWRKHVVDMAYDIEDCIDDFMHRAREAEGKVGILQKASHCLKTFKDHYLIANEIHKIKIRVIEASKRRLRYKLDDFISNTTLVAVDPRISALYKETASLVGIDTPMKEVIKLLRDEGQQLIVVPIIGFGGLGKTTLANEVYREIGGQFNCNAFVAASQKPNITTLRLTVKEMSKSSWEDHSIIGKLPSLILLNLKITGVLTERIVIGGSTGFALLQSFEFNYDGTSHLTFESGAMPKLRELMLRLDPWAWDKATPVGLHHLSSLKEINVYTLELRGSTTRSGESGQKIMNSVFSKAAAAIPSRPAVAVWCG